MKNHRWGEVEAGLEVTGVVTESKNQPQPTPTSRLEQPLMVDSHFRSPPAASI